MLKKLTKTSLIFLLLLLIFIIATGCGSQPANDENKQPSEEQEVKKKVAIILPGSISDMGWNQNGYEAIIKAKDKYGIEVSYQESVPAGELKDVVRNYAAEKYDLIIAHDLYYSDPVLEVAQEFPHIMFGVTSGGQGADNVVAMTVTNWEATYLAGALAGLISETGTVGILTATDSPIAARMYKGFETGAKTLNSDVRAIHAYVGSWDDVVKGKELVRSMAREGADVIYTQSGQINVGAVEAAREAGILAIGAIVDMSVVAPDTVVASAILPPGVLVTLMIENLMNGELIGGAYVFGVKEGAEDLLFNPLFESKLSDEIKNDLNSVRDDIINGKIPAPTI